MENTEAMEPAMLEPSLKLVFTLCEEETACVKYRDGKFKVPQLFKVVDTTERALRHAELWFFQFLSFH